MLKQKNEIFGLMETPIVVAGTGVKISTSGVGQRFFDIMTSNRLIFPRFSPRKDHFQTNHNLGSISEADARNMPKMEWCAETIPILSYPSPTLISATEEDNVARVLL